MVFGVLRPGLGSRREGCRLRLHVQSSKHEKFVVYPSKCGHVQKSRVLLTYPKRKSILLVIGALPVATTCPEYGKPP